MPYDPLKASKVQLQAAASGAAGSAVLSGMVNLLQVLLTHKLNFIKFANPGQSWGHGLSSP